MDKRQAERVMDCTAAGLLAAAVAFSALELASGLVAILAPLAFALAFAYLARADGERSYPLATFDLEPIVPRRDAPDDAGQALSDAFAQLKRSLR